MTFDDPKLEEAWQKALQLLRDQGYDPDEVVRQAAANLEYYQKNPAVIPQCDKGEHCDCYKYDISEIWCRPRCCYCGKDKE